MKKVLFFLLVFLTACTAPTTHTPTPTPLWGYPEIYRIEFEGKQVNCHVSIETNFKFIGTSQYGEDLWQFQGANSNNPAFGVYLTFRPKEESFQWALKEGDVIEWTPFSILEANLTPKKIEWEKEGFLNSMNWWIAGNKIYFEHRGIDEGGAIEWTKKIRECIP